MAQAVVPAPRHANTRERWEKALQRALEAGIEVFTVNDTGERLVTSATKLDTLYRTDGRRCSCPAALAGDQICQHRAVVRFVMGWLALPEAEPAPACPDCNGCGAVDYGRYALPCDACGGAGIAPDRRPHGLPAVVPVAAAA